MSANKCKFCNGSGWYEPKNMGGMMVEPCNRCDAHKKNQAAQKLPQTSADACPVCGCGEHMKSGIGFSCGGQTSYSDCGQAEDLAISRAAEIERLRAALERIAKQGPCLGIDGRHTSWKHWAQIANETLNKSTQLCRDDRRSQGNQEK